MRMRITEYTWIHTSILALATAFVTSACDEAEAIDEEELAVESIDEEKPESGQVDGQAVDELKDVDAEADADEEVNVDDERRRRDDDGWGRRRRHDDDGWGRRRRHDDDGWGRRRRHDDDGWGRHW
ncbi:hypothetical protein OV203_37860 [Nannocystis sp. ILAH1]|uniref:hypothetical protein n=1 Tax=Nannocystis sp. ILAH1 TaxID=2996789 RepID=UPI0022700831|nr:hypothetical protein [Nannocystis sp. ILAH1]MCY0992969.1 hypothetical protein [Nannocystis sp. ILAH1]